MTRLKRKKALPSENKDDVRFGTPEDVATYRAQRLAAYADTIIEVGAGAGFQSRAFAKEVKQVIAIEIDKERFARFSDVPANVLKITGDALDLEVLKKVKQSVQGRVVVFLDPERPAESKERTLAEIQPNIPEFIKRYSEITQEIAIELPPFLSDIPFEAEREYLSVDGQLNRLTIYMGELKKADISVVRLPGGERLEHSGRIPTDTERLRSTHKFLLEPDRALVQSGLVNVALPHECTPLNLGNQIVYITRQKPASPFFRVYTIIARGERIDIMKALRGARCGTLIPHGKLQPQAQQFLLKTLKPLCKGTRRLHLFLGREQYLVAPIER